MRDQVVESREKKAEREQKKAEGRRIGEKSY